jgi:hypothetical protein
VQECIWRRQQGGKSRAARPARVVRRRAFNQVLPRVWVCARVCLRVHAGVHARARACACECARRGGSGPGRTLSCLIMRSSSAARSSARPASAAAAAAAARSLAASCAGHHGSLWASPAGWASEPLNPPPPSSPTPSRPAAPSHPESGGFIKCRGGQVGPSLCAGLLANGVLEWGEQSTRPASARCSAPHGHGRRPGRRLRHPVPDCLLEPSAP